MNIWAEDISENIIVRKMSCFNHAGQLTVPCYSLSHFHPFVRCLGTVMPNRNIYSAIYSKAYAAIYIYSFVLDKLSVFSVDVVWVLLTQRYQILQESYTQMYIHFILFTSIVLAMVYPWFCHKKKKITNKQATHHRLSILALEIAIYNGVVSL